MKLRFRHVCLFWGIMDALYLAHYLWANITRQRLPFISDVLDFTHHYAEQGGGIWLVVIFILSMITTLSLVLSAILLLMGRTKVFGLIVLQTPLRLLLVIPSITFLPWLFATFSHRGIAVAISLLILSEVIKVGSFIIAKRGRQQDI